MPDYEKLYHLLFNAVTDALEQIEQLHYQAAVKLLMDAQRETEELYIES